MTTYILRALLRLDQRTYADAARYEICGEVMLAAILTAVGIPTTPQMIIDYLESIGGGEGAVSSGTYPWFLGRYLDHIGVPWHWYDVQAAGAFLPVLDRSMANGWYVGWMGKDDGNGQPSATGTFRHYIGCWSNLVDTMNSWGGTESRYARDAMEAAAVYALVPERAAPATPAPSGPPGPFVGDDMSIIRRPDGTGFDELVQGDEPGAGHVWHRWAPTVAGLKAAKWEDLGGQTHRAPWGMWENDMSAFHVRAVGTDSNLYNRTYFKATGWEHTWSLVGGKSPG